MRLFDLHCDTVYECDRTGCPISHCRYAVRPDEALLFSRYCQAFALFVPDSLRGEAARQHVHRLLQVYRTQMKENPVFNQNANRSVVTVEGGAALAGDLAELDFLKENGVCALTLTWNGEDELGGGCQNDTGLTDFGKRAVLRMQELSMAVDVSHLGERTFYELAEAFDGPLIATHSNARGVCSHVRNLTDRQFSEICRRKGIVGMTLCDRFLRENGGAGIADVLRHIYYFLERGGETVLAVGTDFDGTDTPAELSSLKQLPVLYEALLRSGISDATADRIFYKNAADYFDKTGLTRYTE